MVGKSKVKKAQLAKDKILSRFRGVTWNKRNSKWLAKISFKGKTRYIGTYFDEVAAAKAFDEEARALRGSSAKVNFPQNAEEKALTELCSNYHGVSWHKGHVKWRAEIRVVGKKRYIGHFKSQVEAAIVYDENARTIMEENKEDDVAYVLNFPELSHFLSLSGYGRVEYISELNVWRSTVKEGGVRRSLGDFDERRGAKRALKRRLATIREYQVLHVQEYERNRSAYASFDGPVTAPALPAHAPLMHPPMPIMYYPTPNYVNPQHPSASPSPSYGYPRRSSELAAANATGYVSSASPWYVPRVNEPKRNEINE